MKKSQHLLFREQALQQYMRGQKQDTLPHYFRSSVLFTLLWLALGILLILLIIGFVVFAGLMGG